MDFFNQGIPLGRWFRITVVIHWLFLIYAGFYLYHSQDRSADALYLVLLFGTILMHEFGHALSCRAVGGEALHIVLWPLGGLAFVRPPMNPWAWLVTTVCGPLVNAILWPLFYVITFKVLPGYLPGLALHSPRAAEFIWYGCWNMYAINKGLLLFNLIPAYPMDGGQMLQEVLWILIGYPKSLHIAGMVGTVCGASFIVLGLGLRTLTIPIVDYTLATEGRTDPMLLTIGVISAAMSFNIYQRSQEIKGWRKN